MNTPETIYYWDGVVLVSDQRILLGHWLYDTATVRSAEVVQVPNRRRNRAAFIPLIFLYVLAFLALFLLDMQTVGNWEPIFIVFFLAISSLGLVGLLVWALYMRRKQKNSVLVTDLPGIFLLKIHKTRGVGSDYVYLDRQYLERIAGVINTVVENRAQNPDQQSPFADTSIGTVPVPPAPVAPAQNSNYFDGIVDIGPVLVRFGDKTYETSAIAGVTVQPVAPSFPYWAFLFIGTPFLILSLLQSAHNIWPNAIPYDWLDTLSIIVMFGDVVLYAIVLAAFYRLYYLVNIRGSFGTQSVYVTADKFYADIIAKAIKTAQANSRMPTPVPVAR